MLLKMHRRGTLPERATKQAEGAVITLAYAKITFPISQSNVAHSLVGMDASMMPASSQ
jgi:hypothetical protein